MANRVGRRCDRDKESFWRAAVGRCESGGLSVRAFCRREGIAEPSFYHWRRELVRREAVRTGSESSGKLEPQRRVELSDTVEPSRKGEPQRGTAPGRKVVPGASSRSPAQSDAVDESNRAAPEVAISAPVAGRASIAIPRAGSADEEAGPLFVPVRIPGADCEPRICSHERPDPHPTERQSSDERQSVAQQRRTQADDRPRGDSVVEVVLRGGRVLRFVGGLDRRALADLVAALEADAC